MNNSTIKNPLYTSLAIVVLMMLAGLARNIFLMDETQSLSQSIPMFLAVAFLIGGFYVLVVHFLLRYTKEKYRDIGFVKENILKQIRMGVLFGILIFILQNFIMHPLISAIVPKTTGKEVEINTLFSSLWYLPILIVLSVLKGGFSEELWRVFVLTRFQKCFGKPGLITALIFGSILFGFGHLYQGIASVISVSIVGFLYALIYLRKGNAWEAVVGHATYDIVGTILGFILYYGK
ncbi:MAG: CPBP family intramembrane glutamic endopeptidase [Bacteroidota bacterium]